MIDQALLLTIVIMGLAVTGSARLWPPTREENRDVIGLALPALGAGLLVGRLAAMALDDPAGILQVRDVFVIRGGVELWPGVAAGLVLLVALAKREGADPWSRLADLAPHALVAYGAFEAACVLRDGCFGPTFRFGLRPDGVAGRQLPIGLLLALAVGLLAVLVRRVQARPVWAVLAAVGGVASLRTIAAFGLPHIGTGLTRQHAESVAVLGLAALAAALAMARTSRASDRP